MYNYSTSYFFMTIVPAVAKLLKSFYFLFQRGGLVYGASLWAIHLWTDASLYAAYKW